MPSKYMLTAAGAILRDDGAWVPVAPGNRDYDDYTAWCGDGNVPDQLVDSSWQADVWAEFKDMRDVYLSRLEGLAGRASRSGDTGMATAADALAHGIIAIPQDTRCASATDKASLRLAIKMCYHDLIVAALGNQPNLAYKAAFDAVFS